MTTSESIPQLVGATAAMCAFSIAVLGGLAVENAGTVILSRALPSMVLCYLAGSLIGMAAQACVREHTENYRKKTPVREEEMHALERHLHEVVRAERG